MGVIMQLIHFTADWCQPCKKMKPIINEFLAENPDIDYQMVDIEEDFERTRGYQVLSIPTLIAIKNGGIYNRMSGIATKEQIAKLFD